jgi:long-chain acyl-CoA synthetase
MRGPVDVLKSWWRFGRGNGKPQAETNGNGRPGTEDARKAWLLRRDKKNGNGHAPEPRWYRLWDANGVPRTLTYPSTTLGRMLDQTADRFGDACAMIYHDRKWTYSELRAEVNRMAGGLARLGVRKNDRVVMALPNCPEFVISFFAIQKLGGVVVNAGPLMGLDDLQKLITMTSPRVVVGLDLRARVLVAAGAGSTIENWVWVTLQSYQGVIKRLGYQFKLWQESSAKNGDSK